MKYNVGKASSSEVLWLKFINGDMNAFHIIYDSHYVLTPIMQANFKFFL
jgi:hypothetical protein